MKIATASLIGLLLAWQGGDAGPPVTGLTAASAVAHAYDAVLDADFAAVPDRLAAACGPARPEVCRTVELMAQWWEIALEPERLTRDAPFAQQVERTIAANAAWVVREPARAEAWFYLGVAYGARVQFRALRNERLGAARDGKQVRMALERALALDPTLEDAYFGIGMYRYYAAVAPALLRMFRWLLLLPGGDRADGLRQIQRARDRGAVVASEADYQLHLIYLWYEHTPREALAIVQRLQGRYPRNPLFHHAESDIQDVYFHDARASLRVSTRLLRMAERGEVHESALASVRARLNIATQLARLGEVREARTWLEALIAERPARPAGADRRARALLDSLRDR
ncbi:MAG: hypothetical protein ACT4QD_08515 [Acidobacteriota bacterium]